MVVVFKMKLHFKNIINIFKTKEQKVGKGEIKYRLLNYLLKIEMGVSENSRRLDKAEKFTFNPKKIDKMDGN